MIRVVPAGFDPGVVAATDVAGERISHDQYLVFFHQIDISKHSFENSTFGFSTPTASDKKMPPSVLPGRKDAVFSPEQPPFRLKPHIVSLFHAGTSRFHNCHPETQWYLPDTAGTAH